MPRPLELPPIPESIGPYRILSIIGQGGMGVVYLGEHRVSSERAAIKTVRLPREALFSALRREIHALKSLRHPGVVRILEQGVESAMPWYAMELLEGRTLADWIRAAWKNQEGKAAETPTVPVGVATTVPIRSSRGDSSARLSPRLSSIRQGPPAAGGALPFALSVVRELCETLSFVHGEGIIHGDIKPENIFLCDGKAPVLMDFGIAWRTQGAVGREVLDVAASAGTVAYMAPEQIRGEIVDARADLYAVGCVLYEVVTGRPPFVESSIQDVMTAHLSAMPRRPSTIVEGLPPGLDDVMQMLLEKRPRERFGHADDIARALAALGSARLRPPAPGRPRPYVYRPELVGRREALDVLTASLKRTRTGRGSAALVRGESGIGKTYLATTFAREAERRGFTVIAGACAAVAASSKQDAPSIDASLHPFGPFLQAVADRCLAMSPALTATLLGERGKVLAACAPFFAQLPGQDAIPDPPELASKAARARLLGALADTILVFASQSPLLLILDDLQWADELSLELLSLLLDGRGETTSLLILGTYRAEETTPALLELEARPGIGRVTLGRLDEESVSAMVSDMLALDAVPSPFVSFLAREADGNPFFVAEYVRTAVTEGLLRRNASGRWEIDERKGPSGAAPRLPLPTSLHALVVHHLAGLSPGARRLALAASVLGREVSVELLLEVAELSDDAAMDALRELALRQILDEPEPGQLRFLHDKLREIAYTEIPKDPRRALHRRAAVAIEAHSQGAQDRARFYPQLAHHFRRAGDAPKAIEYLEKAGAQALASFANREAAGFFRDLIAVGEEALLGSETLKARRESSSIVDIGRRRRLSARTRLAFTRWERQLADAHHGLGDLRATSQHAARALAWSGASPPEDGPSWALRLAREIPIQAAHRLLPGVLSRRAPLSGVVSRRAPLSGALGTSDAEVARDLRRERARALVRLSKGSYFGSDLRWVIASLWCVNEAEQADATEHAAKAYALVGLLFGTHRLPALARPYFALSRAAAERGSDPSALADCLSVEALSLVSRARWDEARAACAAAERITETIRDGHALENLWTITGMIDVSVGRFEESSEVFGRIARSAKERGDTQHVAWSLLGAGLAMLRLGQLDEVKRLIAEAEEPVTASEDQSMHVQRAALSAQVHLLEGDLRKAQKEAELVFSMVNGRMPVNAQVLGYSGMAEVHLARWEQARLGRPEEAARARKAAERALRSLFLCSLRSRIGAPIYYRLKGRERWLAGDEESARAAFERALELALELKMPYGEATARLELARVAPPGSAARGAHRDRAEALFEAMECRLDLAACRALRER